MEIEYLLVRQDEILKKALVNLNKSGLGTLFVVDESQFLIGILTDGTIRRSLLSGHNLETPVSEVMIREFVSFPVSADNAVILHAINEQVKVIPLVDDLGRVVDYASINKIRRISIASPLLTGNELAYVTDCIKTNWISSQGKYVHSFESLFSKYHQDFHALAVSNGTVALHLALETLQISAQDEVIVPDLTFAASVNAILYTGAVPVLADAGLDTWNMDVSRIEALITPRTKAIMPVHLYGNPCDMHAICDIAAKYNLYVIEDCAEALGSYYKGKPVGTFGDAATFSFYGNKTITTGEGGMVLFKDSKMAEKAAVLRDHGMRKSRRYWHDEIGYNYRLTNLQAAVGVAQFERLDEFVRSKRRIAQLYNEVLQKSGYFQLPVEKEDTINSYWLYSFLVKPSAPFTREQLMDHLSRQGVETRPLFYPAHIMPPYQAFGRAENLANAQFISDTGMSLPSSVNLSEPELMYICDKIHQL